jgi:starvation-inducible DNA-binding protein
MQKSLIPENPIVTEGKEGVSYILEAQKVLLKLEVEILQLAGNADDEGTSALMSDLIREKEKTNWMFRSYLNH